MVAGARILVDITRPALVVPFTTDGQGERSFAAPIAGSAVGTIYGQAVLIDPQGGLVSSAGLEVETFRP